MRERSEYSQRELVLMMAEEILSMHSEIEMLKNRNAHLEEMNELYFQSAQDSRTHNDKMTGAILLAAIGANDEAIKVLNK